jgi:hypothetical protein
MDCKPFIVLSQYDTVYVFVDNRELSGENLQTTGLSMHHGSKAGARS